MMMTCTKTTSSLHFKNNELLNYFSSAESATLVFLRWNTSDTSWGMAHWNLTPRRTPPSVTDLYLLPFTMYNNFWDLANITTDSSHTCKHGPNYDQSPIKTQYILLGIAPIRFFQSIEDPANITTYFTVSWAIQTFLLHFYCLPVLGRGLPYER